MKTRVREDARILAKLGSHVWREGASPGSLWTVEKLSRNVHRVTMLCDTAHQFEWHGLLSSDRHHDNAHTDQDMERRHLDEIVRRKGGVIDCGDLHCSMQGKWDPRADRSALRPEYQAGDYLDALVREAVKFYTPYADRFVVIGRGNHETAIHKRHETDLTERLCERMSALSGAPVHSGGYGGWVHFVVRYHSQVYTLALKYFHGSGGGGLMSMDTLRVRRIASWTPDADVIVGGHTHDQWIMAVERERLRTNGGDYKVEIATQHHVRCGTYKDEYGDGFGGWHIERGGPPKSLGAVWMRMYLQRNPDQTKRLAVEFTRAS